MEFATGSLRCSPSSVPGWRIATVAAGTDSRAIGRHDDQRFEVGSCFKAFVAAKCCRQVSTVTLDEAARATIAVSDNTATDMVMDLIEHDMVVALVSECGLSEPDIPRSVGDVYSQAEHVRPIACVSTMRELTRFYATVLSPESSLDEIARSDFKRLMRREDLGQGTTWPVGAVCYRRSGSLESPPMFAMAMAGALGAEHHQARFAFAINGDIR